MPRNRKWNKLHRLQRLLAQNLQSFEERRLALREALTDDTFGTRAESEWGFASAARGLGAGLLSISAHTVQSIEDALRRVRAGTYGSCDDCGGEIALQRLRALPFAQTCVQCQERRDESRGGTTFAAA